MASPNRLITLDTETTGLDAQNGDRIIEIGCVAIEGRMMRSTDEHHLQIFVNPEREVPEEAVAIHGLRRNTCRTSRSLPKSPISSLIL